MGAGSVPSCLSGLWRPAKVGGGRIIVMDPIDQAARDFYRHHDFVPTKGDDRLVMKVATAEAALG